jgi:hypothetical protein
MIWIRNTAQHCKSVLLNLFWTNGILFLDLLFRSLWLVFTPSECVDSDLIRNACNGRYWFAFFKHGAQVAALALDDLTPLMMAAMLGEVEGSRRLLAKDPACLNTVIRGGNIILAAEDGTSALMLGKPFILLL